MNKKVINYILFGIFVCAFLQLIYHFNKDLVAPALGVLILTAGVWGRLAGIVMLKPYAFDEEYVKIANNTIIIIGIIWTILALILTLLF